MVKYYKYLHIGGVLALLVLAFFIIKPYVIALLTSAIIAYLFYPLFKWVNKKLKNKFASAVIVSILIILVIAVPLILSVNVMTKEAYLIYLTGKQRLTGDFLSNCDNVVCKMVIDWSSDARVQYYFQEALRTSMDFILNWVSKLVLGIPALVINLFISFFVVFYLLKDGDIFVEKLKRFFRMHQQHNKLITNRLNDVMYAVVYGNLIIALIQGGIGALSFWIFGVSSPLIWGIVMAIVSFAPYVGTAMIWIPASLIFVYDGVSTNETMLIWKGVLLFLVNLLAGGFADSILRPKVIGKRAKVHPVLILLGIFGGIALFGLPGFIIGPVVLAMAGTFIDIYISKNNG
ncbi:MAG: AI-2E family transporter [Nanoarchaeota archaeon]|nr:AI-2E family transporter [Nanoarchaeota archaeon]